MYTYCATNNREARASLKPLYNLAPQKTGWVERSQRNLNWALRWDVDDGEKGAGKSEGSRLYALETNKHDIYCTDYYMLGIMLTIYTLFHLIIT